MSGRQRDGLYARAFLRWIAGWRLTPPQRRELDSRRTPDGSYPVPRHIDPTVTERTP